MSLNLTQAGLESIFLTDPVYGAKFRCCLRFRRLVAPSAKAPPERAFTVRLHFAEPQAVAAGTRVFDVAIQGRTLLRDFDIAAEGGTRCAPVVKEFGGVRATDRIRIALSSSAGTERLPVLSAVELVEEH